MDYAGEKEYADFLKRLPGLIAVYDINQYNYAKHIFQVKSQYIPDTEANVLNVVLSTIDNTPVYYTFDGSEPTASSNIYTDTLKIGQSCTLKAITIRPNGSSAVLKEDIKFNKATMKPITMQQPINEKYKLKERIHSLTDWQEAEITVPDDGLPSIRTTLKQ